MIVYCCSDLIFATKIAGTAQALGVTARPARDAEALTRRLDQVDDGKPHGPVRAVLVDLDLADVGLSLIRLTKAHAAAPAVVAFGSHVATALLAQAREAGADFVMPRSQFTATLPALIERFGLEKES